MMVLFAEFCNKTFAGVVNRAVLYYLLASFGIVPIKVTLGKRYRLFLAIRQFTETFSLSTTPPFCVINIICDRQIFLSIILFASKRCKGFISDSVEF